MLLLITFCNNMDATSHYNSYKRKISLRYKENWLLSSIVLQSIVFQQRCQT